MARWQAKTAYAKSADTRRTILDAALEAFGEASFDAVSTRAIAARAGVNQPAIAYYFKNKEGLYRACAQEIVDRTAERTAEASIAALEALNRKAAPDEARALLKTLLADLADVLVSSGEATTWAAFVQRELSDPGPAHALLSEHLWLPGIDLVAHLIAAIKQAGSVDDQSRVEAIMLISNLTVFTAGRSVSAQAMGWSDMGASELALVLRAINAQIDGI